MRPPGAAGGWGRGGVSRAPAPRPSGRPATVAAGAGGLSSKPRRQLRTARLAQRGPAACSGLGLSAPGTRAPGPAPEPSSGPAALRVLLQPVGSEPVPSRGPRAPRLSLPTRPRPPGAARERGTSCQPTPPVPPQGPPPPTSPPSGRPVPAWGSGRRPSPCGARSPASGGRGAVPAPSGKVPARLPHPPIKATSGRTVTPHDSAQASALRKRQVTQGHSETTVTVTRSWSGNV